MWSAARSPEELERLFEDAWLMRDEELLAALVADGGVLAADTGQGPLLAGARRLWRARRAYVGTGVDVVRSRDLALVAAPAATHVARRGPDGAWRLAIALLHDTADTSEGAQP